MKPNYGFISYPSPLNWGEPRASGADAWNRRWT